MQYIASCTFGKDSIATILLALMHNEPLDFAVFSEVMFDTKNGISGEIPEHIEWVKDVAIPKLEILGCPVKVLTHSDYLEQFYHVNTKGKNIGKRRGFPLGGKCVINRECKPKPIRDFFKNNPDVVQYVGIAIDEPQRLERMRKKKNEITCPHRSLSARRDCEIVKIYENFVIFFVVLEIMHNFATEKDFLLRKYKNTNKYLISIFSETIAETSSPGTRYNLKIQS